MQVFSVCASLSFTYMLQLKGTRVRISAYQLYSTYNSQLSVIHRKLFAQSNKGYNDLKLKALENFIQNITILPSI
mgnify:CR=1 FL=1